MAFFTASNSSTRSFWRSSKSEAFCWQVVLVSFKYSSSAVLVLLVLSKLSCNCAFCCIFLLFKAVFLSNPFCSESSSFFRPARVRS